MKRTGVTLFFVLLVISATVNAAQAGDKNVAEDLNQVTSLIAKVKDFSKDLGLRKTDNFKRIDQRENNFRTIFYKPKNRVPFGYYDSGFVLLDYARADYSLKENLKALGISSKRAKRYDFYYDNQLKAIYAGNTPVFSKMAQGKSEELIRLVMHEDWHSNSGLPHYFDEAAADLFAGVSALSFLGRETEIPEWLDNQVKGAVALNQAWQSLADLDALYQARKLSVKAYRNKKRQAVGVYNKNRLPVYCIPDGTEWIDETMICCFHSYSAYFPFLAEVFRSTGYDLREWMRLLKSTPSLKPVVGDDREIFFRKSQQQERIAIAYLKKAMIDIKFTVVHPITEP